VFERKRVALWDVESLKSWSTIREKPAPLIPYEVYIVKIVKPEILERDVNRMNPCYDPGEGGRLCNFLKSYSKLRKKARWNTVLWNTPGCSKGIGKTAEISVKRSQAFSGCFTLEHRT